MLNQMLVLIQNCKTASGSYVALRINVVIVKELNLGNLRSVACKGSMQEKVEWFCL